MSDQAPHHLPNSVIVSRKGDQWLVQFIDNGIVHENTFALEAHASSYADGQRLRLGLLQGLPPVDFFRDQHTN